MKKLYVVSTGAGGYDYLTKQALEALNESEVIVSYTKYAKELSDLIKDKEVFTSGMTEEIARCKKAIEYALNGKVVSLISNGDIHVFAMATLVVELIDDMDLWDEIDLELISGVTSCLAAASKIGAPISQDFAVISLSDRLNSIEGIDKRVKLALEGDFVIGIYNPKSKTRIKPYENFLNALSNYDRIVIIASNIGREKEQVIVTTSKQLVKDGIDNKNVSMNTLIIVGNSTTRLTKNNLVLTPRGYTNKYGKVN